MSRKCSGSTGNAMDDGDMMLDGDIIQKITNKLTIFFISKRYA